MVMMVVELLLRCGVWWWSDDGGRVAVALWRVVVE